MRVISINIINEHNRLIDTLTIGAEYEIVAISIEIENKRVLYNILDDVNRLAFYEAALFSISDNNIDPDWVFITNDFRYVKMLPKALSYATFYEDYHNDEPNAISTFKKRFPNFKGF